MKKQRVIVIGAGGFLGSHISNFFHEQHSDVFLVGKLSDNNNPPQEKCFNNVLNERLPSRRFEQLVREIKPDAIIHCAGTSSVINSMAAPFEDFTTSVNLCAYILETIRLHSPKSKFVLLSSAAVYGCPEVLPISENTLLLPISPYGYHKVMNELLAEEYNRIYGITTIILRIFSAYGEGLRKQVLYDMCNKFLDKTTNTIKVYGTGKETRDFIHVNDLCKSIDVLLTHGAVGVHNIGSGTGTSIEQLLDLISQNFESKKQIEFTGETRQGDPLYWEADIKKLSAHGFRPEISIQEGVTKYCKWFKNTFGG